MNTSRLMRRFRRLVVAVVSVAALVASFAPSSGRAQSRIAAWQQHARQLTPTGTVATNFIQVLATGGDSLWIGADLTVYPEDEARFLTPTVPALDDDNTVFALDVDSETSATSTVWAGLAFDTGDGVAGAGGFVRSTDGGDTFAVRGPALDGPADTTLTYGPGTLSAVPITQEAESAPQFIEFDPTSGTVWAANARAGIRTSTDDGETWRRVVLPPDTLNAITPDQTYDFTVAPPLNDGRGFLNYVGLSVLVDATGTVWAGTAAGVNRSRPQDVNAAGERAWQRFAYDGTPDGLTGNSVVALAEQPLDGSRNLIWMATWALNVTPTDRQRFGVTITPDGGDTFRQTLIGEQVFDFAFRGDVAYAATPRGLFVSTDFGRSWRSITDFALLDEEAFIASDAEVRAVATTPQALWLGTTQGLLRLPRADEPLLANVPPASRRDETPRWELFRTNVPVNPTAEQESDEVPDVATYAYPNPFSPASDGVVRIRYEMEQSGTVEIEIFDFGMNKVRTLTDRRSEGQHETVWNGTDAGGLRLPNGPYFYVVDTGSDTARGKILLVE